MSFNEWLRSIEKNTGLKVLVIMTSLLSIPSLSNSFFTNKEPQITFEIINNVKVLDVHADVSKLNILYDSMSLKQKDLNLRLFTIRVLNDGGKNIILDDYDKRDSLGIKVLNGCILEKPILLSATDDYIKNNLRIEHDTSSIKFSPILIDQKQSFEIKVMVIEKNDTPSTIIPTGKISGIKQLFITNNTIKESDLSFWQYLYSGGILVHTVRFVLYAILLLVFLFISLVIAIIISENKREKIVREFKIKSKYRFNQKDRFIFERYISQGGHFLTRTTNIIIRCHLYNAAISNESMTHEQKGFIEKNYNFGFRDKKYYHKLVKSGFITPTDNEIIIDQQMASTFDSFGEFLISKGLVKFVH